MTRFMVEPDAEKEPTLWVANDSPGDYEYDLYAVLRRCDLDRSVRSHWEEITTPVTVIDGLILDWEREYVRSLNALLASGDNDADYQRWNGHAAQLRDCLRELHSRLGRPVPPYMSTAWRVANGVTHTAGAS